jgi:Predicted oxidoreductases of the aldo/keto reductase family
MNKQRLGKTEIFVTPIGMGVLTVGSTQLNLSLERGAEIVRYAIEKGIGFLDTAEYYRTYPHIRRALDDLSPSFSSNALSRPIIVSKSLSYDYKGMERAIDDCRRSLNLDQIDVFLLHEVREAPDFEHRAGAWACLNDAKAKGRVKAIGLSTHHTDVVKEASTTAGMDVIFPLINIQSLGIRTDANPGTKEDMAEAIRCASEQGIGVFAMKALGGGNLVVNYKQALDYVADLPGVSSIMLGMGSMKDVDDAILWANDALPCDYMPDTVNKRMFVDRGDCEGCGACVSRCTSKAIHLDSEGIAVVDNEKCVLCGYCAPVCPTRALIYL